MIRQVNDKVFVNPGEVIAMLAVQVAPNVEHTQILLRTGMTVTVDVKLAEAEKRIFGGGPVPSGMIGIKRGHYD